MASSKRNKVNHTGFWRLKENQFWNDPEKNYTEESKKYFNEVFLKTVKINQTIDLSKNDNSINAYL